VRVFSTGLVAIVSLVSPSSAARFKVHGSGNSEAPQTTATTTTVRVYWCNDCAVYATGGWGLGWGEVCRWSTCRGCGQCGHCTGYCAAYATGGYGYSWDQICRWSSCEACGQCRNSEAPQTTATTTTVGGV
jgi:hypothetical protein